ncbi:MAG: hypothetical protein ACYCS9_07510 [Candidatus Dormibacteria bacterium]
MGRRVVCLVALGNIDLDLRQARPTERTETIVVLGVLGSVDAYLPEEFEA